MHEISLEPLNRTCAKFTGKRIWSLARTNLKVKVKGQGHRGQKRHFSALSAACVRFMFGKTSLASSYKNYSTVSFLTVILHVYTAKFSATT